MTTFWLKAVDIGMLEVVIHVNNCICTYITITILPVYVTISYTCRCRLWSP